MSNNTSKSSILYTQTPPNVSGTARVDMRKRDFEALIWGKSYDLFIDTAIKCPCRNRKDNQALSACKNCGGSGWLFINRRESQATLQSMNNDTKFKEWSEELLGTSKMTFLSKERIQHMDRITIRNATIGTQQTLHIKEIQGALRVKTIYPIEEVEEIFLFKNTDEPLVRLLPEVDYTIENGNWITIDPKHSGEGQLLPTITIRYTHNPQYYVLDIIRAVMTSKEKMKGTDEDSAMPLSAMMRLCHYVIDEENFHNTYLFDNSYKDACPK